MPQRRKKMLTRLAVFCLGTSALTVPVFAASFSVGGGTITTTQADTSVDNTGTGGAFELRANTVSSGDVITVSNINTTALDVGNLLPSTGSYSVTMQGSTLSSYTFFRSLSGGPISFDSTGGPGNVLSGDVALNVGVNTGSGGVSIKTGADVINGIGGGVGGIAISAVGPGPVSVDTVGATITSAGLYGIVAQSGNADVTIGALNGGMASSITASSGFGIYTTAGGTARITIASSGSVIAQDALWASAGPAIVTNFGTISATNDAINASFASSLNVSLQSSSTTSGILLGSPGADTFSIFGGANITGASFNGNGGSDTLILTGSGGGTFSQSSATNIGTYQMLGSGIWTLTGSPPSSGGWTVASGTLRAGGGISINAIAINGGIFDVNGQAVTVGALSGTGGTITLGSGSLATNSTSNTVLATAISGSGSFTKAGAGTLTLMATNTYSGGTNINGGTLKLGVSGALLPTGAVTLGPPILPVVSATVLDIGANNQTVGEFSGSGMIHGSGNLIINQATTTSCACIFTGGGAFVFNGPGAISGLFGPLVVNGGTVSLNGAVNFSTPLDKVSPYGQSLTVNGGTVALVNSGGPVTGNFEAGVTQLSGTGGTVALGSSGILQVFQTSSTVFAGTITGTRIGPIGSAEPWLSMQGSGTLTLSGINTYTGNTAVFSGTLAAGAAGAFSPNSDFDTEPGGTLDLNNFSQTVSSLLGSGGTTKLGTATLTLTASSGIQTIVFNNALTYGGSITGTGGVNINGNALFIFTGANSYSGTTVINAGTLQIGSGGAAGTIVGDIADNAQLIFNRSDSFTYAGHISGNGLIQVAGPGTFILTGSSAGFTGTTTISAGALQLGDGVTNGVLGGNIVDNAALIVDTPGGSILGGISGSGSVQQIGRNSVLVLIGTNTYTGGTIVTDGTVQLGPLVTVAASLAPTGALTVNGGTFDLNTHVQTVGAISGTGGNIALSGGMLTTDTSASTTYAGQITGTGVFAKAGAGTLILTGDSTYVGDTRLIGSSGTLITGGVLQIGNGGTTGSILGNVFNDGTLAFNRSNNLTFSGVVYGSGKLIKSGTGTLTLSGANVYTGATTASAGTLNVTGSIASSAVTVQSGATLGGTGTVGSTTIQSGGTLAPGSSIGTLTVNGNLTLASGSIYNVEMSPAAADRTMVSGTAGINGTVAASIAPGVYTFGQRYTLLTATGGVSGTFASLTGIPVFLKGGLSYDTNNVYLTLSPNALAPLLSNVTSNQSKVVAAIDASVAAGNVPGGGFVTLYSLSGSALNSALDQISGQVGPNTINAVGQASLSFLTMTAQGGSGGGNFAPDSAYCGADAPHRAQLGAGETRVWASAYGGHVGLSADAASGAASLSSSNVGLIGGADMAWDGGLLAGVTVGLGRQNFTSGNGTGSSDDIMIGVYARKDAGPLYVTAAFGYGSHHIETLRVVTVSGTDVLQGKQHADDFGGRIEAGWRTALDEQFTLSPYFAVAAENFDTPAYTESALSGTSTFALSVAAHSSTLGRTELGSGLSRNYETENGLLTADLRLAWAHQLDDVPLTQASFQTLPGAGFLVTGVRPSSDAALLGAGIQVQNRSGLFFGFKGETQLGAGTTILEGMGHLGWRW